MSYDTRFKYPALYKTTHNTIMNGFGHLVELNDYDMTEYNMFYRKRLRAYMATRNRTFKDMIRDGFFDCLIYKCDIIVLIRDNMILNEIPIAYKKREERLHRQRIEVSKLAMRGIKRKTSDCNICLPSDIVPLVCAFAVPGSKKYKYM